MERHDSTPSRLDLEPDAPPPVRGELPPRERDWPLWVWLLVAVAALVVTLVAVNARLSWF